MTPFDRFGALGLLGEIDQLNRALRDASQVSSRFVETLESKRLVDEALRKQASSSGRLLNEVAASITDSASSIDRAILASQRDAETLSMRSLGAAQEIWELQGQFESALAPSTIEFARSISALCDAVTGAGAGIEAALNGLSQSARYIGVYDYRELLDDQEQEQEQESRDRRGDDAVAQEESRILLPSEMRQRLVRTTYLSPRLVEAVQRDPRFVREMSAREFERLIAELLDGMGDYEDVTLTSRSNDGGRDVLATLRSNGIPILLAFECKRWAENRKVQVDTMRTLLGTLSHAGTSANIGVLVTTSTFTRGANKFIVSEPRVDGKDFEDLVDWIGCFSRRRIADSN